MAKASPKANSDIMELKSYSYGEEHNSCIGKGEEIIGKINTIHDKYIIHVFHGECETTEKS